MNFNYLYTVYAMRTGQLIPEIGRQIVYCRGIILTMNRTILVA